MNDRTPSPSLTTDKSISYPFEPPMTPTDWTWDHKAESRVTVPQRTEGRENARPKAASSRPS